MHSNSDIKEKESVKGFFILLFYLILHRSIYEVVALGLKLTEEYEAFTLQC